MIDGFDVVDDGKDAARKDEHRVDDAESSDGIEAQSVVASLGRMGWMMRNLETTHTRGEEALYCTDNPRI